MKKGTFLPLGWAGKRNEKWELLCTTDWNTKFKNITSTTESKQKNTIDTLSGNKNWISELGLRPCYELYATSRYKCYQFLYISESSINSGQCIKLTHSMTPMKEKLPLGKSFPENPTELNGDNYILPNISGGRLEIHVLEAWRRGLKTDLVQTLNTVEICTEPKS